MQNHQPTSHFLNPLCGFGKYLKNSPFASQFANEALRGTSIQAIQYSGRMRRHSSDTPVDHTAYQGDNIEMHLLKNDAPGQDTEVVSLNGSTTEGRKDQNDGNKGQKNETQNDVIKIDNLHNNNGQSCHSIDSAKSSTYIGEKVLPSEFVHLLDKALDLARLEKSKRRRYKKWAIGAAATIATIIALVTIGVKIYQSQQFAEVKKALHTLKSRPSDTQGIKSVIASIKQLKNIPAVQYREQQDEDETKIITLREMKQLLKELMSKDPPHTTRTPCLRGPFGISECQ